MKMVKKPKQEKDEMHGRKDETVSGAEAEICDADSIEDSREVLKAKLQEKEMEAAENYDKYLRAVAELDNFRKRAARDKMDAIKYGNEQILKDLLPLTDSIDRALQQSETSCDFEAFRKGLDLLRSQLVACLGRHGVEAIDCLRKPFDPNVHEALMQVAGDGHEENEVVDELEKGYLLNGRLLRPAKVSVCKRTRGEQTCEDETVQNGG
ncbi:MAG: nucleotide exchange factor GrpE [Deltaproteobacteria bacterium HGW-Deltaproteobacteria-19]|jgi:molecular chaperone GrpE|nr:MAG: nucleotide exchange factor GrpE [Deltaproteobacteria bacterium HGW-Deltaproteobacteria-19]